MTFVQRRIDVQFTLAPGPLGQQRTFGNTGKDTAVLSGFRTSARIEKAGGLSDSTMDLRMWGVAESTMNELATFGYQINAIPRNRVVVTAGDLGAATSTVFDGYVTEAYIDFGHLPDVSLVAKAQVGIPFSAIPAVATSFRGTAAVATIMSGFAALMGLKFENSGVTTTLANPYYSGSVKEQAQKCVDAGGIMWNRGDDGVLAIWPRDGSRGGQVPIISPETGMVGYPSFNAYGVMLRTLFNPSIGFGQMVEVRSSLSGASGRYSVYMLSYDLESQVPNGKWFADVGGYNPARPTPVPTK